MIKFFTEWLANRRKRRSQFLNELLMVGKHLPLESMRSQKYPLPAISGKYFGFFLSVEGQFQKNNPKPYRIRGVVQLPKSILSRVYLHSEERPATLKPIATLKLIHTKDPLFENKFLLMSDNEKLALSLFQPYLRQRLLSLGDTHWLLDIQKMEAHIEMQTSILNGRQWMYSIRVIAELLNSLLALEKYESS